MVNTGWTGGPYGTGRRMELAYTRRLVSAALNGELDGAETFNFPIFNLEVPAHVEGVPDEVLDPRNTWADGAAYDEQRARLARMFADNFRQFADSVSQPIREAGPDLQAIEVAET